MPAHAEHGSREISEAPRGAPSAAEVWRAQRAPEARTPGDREFGAPGHLGRAHAALGGRVLRIPADHLDRLRRRIEQLDRHARRLGTARITLRDTAERDAAGGVFVVLGRYELIDADGNRLAWWSTAGAPLAQGDVVTLDARGQRHTHFAGTPVTVLTRCHRRPT